MTQLQRGTTQRFRPGTKIAEVHRQLRELAYSKGPEAKLPTTRELCSLYGIGTHPLNDALDELEQQNIIYRKQGSGIFVSPKIHSKIIVVLYEASLVSGPALSPFWGMLLGAMVTEANRLSEARDYQVELRVVNSRANPGPLLSPDLARSMSEMRVHGAIGIGLAADNPEYVISRDRPFVAFAGAGFWHIEFDPEATVRCGIDALIKSGCRNIGMWRPVGVAPEIDIELDPFREHLAARGLRFRPELIRDHRERAKLEDCGTLLQQGYQLARDVFGTGGGPRPDGVVIVDDMLALGALSGLRKLGVAPMRDVMIASHANKHSYTLFDYEDSLILIENDVEELAAAMFEMLETLMIGAPPEEPIRLLAPSVRFPGA
jgi:DNA-binding LacI/PurR family transcriptional regulator